MLRESILVAAIASASAFAPAGYAPSLRTNGSVQVTCQLRPGDSPALLNARPKAQGASLRSSATFLRMSEDDGPLGSANDNELTPVSTSTHNVRAVLKRGSL